MKLPKKYILGLTLIVLLCCSRTVFGQLTGSKSIPGNYATITAAVTALNTSGVGAGGVTFNVAAGYTETISATISLTATGTAANPIIFQKDPATSGANPLITAYTGGVGTPGTATQDGIWRLVGSDYVTINGIDLKDNPSNTTNPSTMEYGFALYKQSTSNGCQSDTIKNCTITLNRINNATGTAPMVDGSTGIIVMNALSTTATTAVTPIAGGTHSNNAFYSNTIQNCNTGIALIGYAAASPFTLADANNDVGGSSLSTGNTIINYGGAAGAANAAAGIRTLAQYSINISYNTINNNNGSGTNHPTIVRGIYNNTALSANATITYNTITVNGTGTTQIITAIENAAGSTAAGNTINISNNTITNCTYTTATSGGLYGIYNTATPATLTINSNTFSGNATSATTGLHYAIFNAGAVTTAININSNNIGIGLANAITFNAANSGAQLFINNTAGAATAALSISNNNFQGINYATAGTGANTYISNTAATLSQAINSNTFTNLNVNTTGSSTFIANSVIVSATGTQNVNSNSISGTFTKAAGGTVTLFTSVASSISGSVINNNNNNFSNITVSGATIIAGWVNTDAGASAKNIQNNTFSNWTGATGAITGINVNITGTNNATSGNTISNISSTGAITGITTGAGNDNIYSNTINTLSTTGAVAVTAISITAGTAKNIYRNKIYDLQSNNATGTVNGILVSGATVVTVNIYNNFISDLRTPGASAADPIRGISVIATTANSTINVYYNTIYLAASSTGTNFGSTGIYHTASATATTATLNLRNNIITNTSTPNGTGITVAYRRSSANLGNYATTSNNNLFFSGVPGATRLLFYDGTNSDQLLSTFKTRVSTRETQSVTEDLISGSRFLSTSGASASFLHLDPTKPTLAESGAVNISGFTDDADAQTRQGNAGYAGSGTAPDIGADEFDGTANTGLAGGYNVGVGQTYTSLTGAGGLFAALNTYGLSNNVTINITSDLAEDGSYILYQWTEQGVGNYTITINPDATTTRTISGDVVAGLIRFNGADRVNIDGSTGRYLTFRNTNTAGTTGTAFTFINGASNNTIQNCTIEAYANATNGVILFSTSTVAGGNSNNQISNCTINASVAGNTSNLCIYSAGTVGNENSTNTISNNTIYNYRDRALDIAATGSTAWTISGNSFYNGDIAGVINYAAASTLHGIRILGGSGYSILNNYIGGNAPLAAGTNAAYSSTLGSVTFQGIVLTTSSATPASYIRGNTIANSTVSCTTGTPSISGIALSAGTVYTIAQNRIYDLQANNAAGTVNGIVLSGATIVTATITNNIIGNLRTPAANSATDAIRAISLLSTTANSTINVYYNTIYLNASSSGTNFSSTGIYHTSSATATTAALNLRNNSISNISTPKGTGLTVAYRRSTTALNNYTTTSNNNLFYAGTPSANNLIFYNGTNSDQTLAAFKTRVSTRETQSVTEDLSTKFLSTSGSSASFLHMNTTIASLVEDNAVNISGFIDDLDGDTRQGNSGYAGYGTSPDIGADEYNGITDNNKTWTGTSSNDWNTATNWLYNSIPAAANNAIIPGSLTTYPLLSTGTYTIQNVTLQSGGTLTVNGATLQIGGAINNSSGTFTVSNGTIEMNGTTAQTIPSGSFAGSTLPNLTITNSAGVTVSGTLNISGTLKASSGTLNTSGFVTLLSTATQTAQIDGSGAGQVLGNVTMQRYLASAFGYKYLSSPFQAATVNELADDLNLAASFPALYKYDESLASSGYVSYTNASGLLIPLQGYAANFGSSATPKTVTISGVVNNGNLSLGTLYNHNNEFTQGFNLVGNPYPSPIDWNAGSGWTRTNIDNALYYFNAGSTDQYTGTYSSYINGVSSDGVASNIIPSMQGFFIHVSNGAYPVSASLAINNNARIKNLTVAFQATPTFRQPPPLLRIDAGFADNKTPSDPLVVYFNDAATPAFDKNYDALKLMNTNAGVPNFYSIASDASKLSVAALRYQGDNVTSIPLGLSIKQSGWISFNVRDLENMPDSLPIYLADAVTGSKQDLRLTTSYRVYLQPGKYESRFSLVFSAKKIVNNPEEQSLFNAYNSQGKLYATTNIDKGTLLISNTMGQVIYRQAISGKGVHELNTPSLTGIHIISLMANNKIQSKKIFIGN